MFTSLLKLQAGACTTSRYMLTLQQPAGRAYPGWNGAAAAKPEEGAAQALRQELARGPGAAQAQAGAGRQAGLQGAPVRSPSRLLARPSPCTLMVGGAFGLKQKKIGLLPWEMEQAPHSITDKGSEVHGQPMVQASMQDCRARQCALRAESSPAQAPARKWLCLCWCLQGSPRLQVLPSGFLPRLEIKGEEMMGGDRAGRTAELRSVALQADSSPKLLHVHMFGRAFFG